MKSAERLRAIFFTAPGFGALFLVLIAVTAPWISPDDPGRMDIANRLASPSWEHPLGQDEYGRDVLSRLMHGARATLFVALASSLIAAFFGVIIGVIGGYFRGIIETLAMRPTDIILSFPPILLALLLVSLLGPGIGTLILVFSILFIPGFVRVTFGEMLVVRSAEYVEAARVLGFSDTRIMFQTILPNIFAAIVVQFSITVAHAIVIESGMSFLGLGVVPPDVSWGLMIRGARAYMAQDSLALIWPSLALIATVFVTNGLCDVLRDVLDPRLGRKALRKAAKAPASETQPVGLPREDDGQIGPDMANTLSLRRLTTSFRTDEGEVAAVKGVSFDVAPRETVAIVGESGSGKSVTSLSILRLLPRHAGVSMDGDIFFRTKDGRIVNITGLPDKDLIRLRGNDIAMIFQEPMSSLNPVYRIGDQIIEAILAHENVTTPEARARARDLLTRVGISDADRRLGQYPHQLSGGMRQRVMIAMALACSPKLLIADEPTTALDVTIQAEIISLLQVLQSEHGAMSMIFITHNLAVVAETADRVLVMYAGEIVEKADVYSLFERPRHPYTIGLLNSIPRRSSHEKDPDGRRPRLKAIPNAVERPDKGPEYCAFAPRCPMAIDVCWTRKPGLEAVGDGNASRCFRWQEL